MKRGVWLVLALLVLGVCLPAVRGQNAAAPDAAARDYLSRHAAEYGLRADTNDLLLTGVTRSLAGWYVRFQQTRAGLPVLGGEVVVALNADLTARLVTSSYVGGLAPPPAAPPALAPAGALQRAMLATGNPVLHAQPSVAMVVYPANGVARLAYRTELPASLPRGLWEVIVDAHTGAILSQRDRLVYAPKGKVFLPNPVASSGNATLRDRRNKAYAKLRKQTFKRKLFRLDGSGKPWGRYCKAVGNKQAVDRWRKYRNRASFEQINAYYHIDKLQAYIQRRLGFTNVNNRQQVANCNTIPDDNSFYSPFSKQITFGSGGVDDAEDAEIIVHEYGHAIQYNQVPNWGASHESRSMGEGFGDYLGGSYGAFLAPDPTFDVCVGEWDATSYSSANPPCLRRLDSTKTYPGGLVGQVHSDGEIWSAALWKIEQAIGRDGAHRIILESHFALPGSALFAQGATAILSANTALRGGADQVTLLGIFQASGIL